MTSVDDGASFAILPEGRSSRKLRSRLGNLFTSKNGPLSEPQIELEEPWREYTRGDVVKGKVILEVAKPLGITHLTVSLFGYVEVFKNQSRGPPGLRANPVRVASGKGKRWVEEYYGDGFASLFEQETSLCGEGRLDPRTYHFQFELPFPRDREMPSSIRVSARSYSTRFVQFGLLGVQFERGTVTYGISATVTRPTTIAPTLTTAQPVNYRQTIDVATLRAPKPRVVTLEPLPNPARANVVRRLTSTSNVAQRSASSISGKSRIDGQRRSHAPTPVPVEGDARSPASPVPSAPSSLSVSSAGRQEPDSPSEPRASQSSQDATALSQTSTDKQIITASIEVSKAGAMPGAVVPLHIFLQHTKKIRSPAGVIVTFYRQARVDMHPNFQAVHGESQDNSKKPQDYYPRSKTGLGGLSLAAAGSSQVWRKDLSQSVSPLYVDEQTMTAVIKANVEIPEDVFPTISNTPGDMITFRYFVEVIVDVHGKWPPGVGMSGFGPSTPRSFTSTSIEGRLGEARPHLTNEGQAFFYPADMKGAIRVHCEIAIGTRDSQKDNVHRRQTSTEPRASSTEPRVGSLPPTAGSNEQHLQSPDSAHGFGDGYDPGFYDPRYYDPRFYDYHHSNTYDSNDPHFGEGYWDYRQQYRLVSPPPNIPEESHLTEKERLRRAEQSLLPSRPPGADDALDVLADHAPSAPFLAEDGHYGPSAPPYAEATSSTSRQVDLSPQTHRSKSRIEGLSNDFDPTREVSPDGAQETTALTATPPSSSTDGQLVLERPRIHEGEGTPGPTEQATVVLVASSSAPATTPLHGSIAPVAGDGRVDGQTELAGDTVHDTNRPTGNAMDDLPRR